MTVRTLFLGLFLLAGLSACEGGGDPAIFDIQPRAGRTEGNQTIRVTGRGFRSDIGYTVYFGTKKAERVGLADPQTLLVLTPRMEEAEAVDVMVRADDGHAWKIEKGFRFEGAAPAADVPGGPDAPTKQNY